MANPFNAARERCRRESSVAKPSALQPSKSRARVLAAGRPLLAGARRARQVRKDVTLEQILDAVIAIAGIKGDPRYLRPILKTTLDGLRLGSTERSPKRATSGR